MRIQPLAKSGPEAAAQANDTARPIRFVHRGAVREVSGLPATTTVLGWLREHERLVGTKEGCNEGDCGACTVLVGELTGELDAQGELRFKPVNSCIQWLPALDGKALLTVEDLGGAHPVQQAMVACHGSQCGFCTPGIVMSLAGTAERCAAAGACATRTQIADDLSGNLCRCTGYRPILDAGEQALADPAALPRLATPALAAQLRALRADAPLQLPAVGPHGPAFDAPNTLAELATLRQAHPEATLLAGCTDIGLWLNKQFRPFERVIALGAVAELQAVHVNGDQLHIGAGASLQAAWDALARHWPASTEMGRRFASRPVREAGTLGGNIANGSPIGDGAPVLMALGATLSLRRGKAVRALPLDAFYLGYMKNALQPGEFIEAMAVPLPQPGDTLRAWKLSKRFDCDISALACGLHLRLEGARGDTVAEARFAFGGLAATVSRATQAEAAVIGQPWTEATARTAMAALAQDFQPLSDLRASAAYRRRAAANLLWRLWLETRPVDPLAASATTVWEAA